MSVSPDHVGEARAAWLTQRERGSGRLLRVFAHLSRGLGRPASRVVLRAVTAYFLMSAPRARRASRTYLALALGREPRFADLWQHFFTFATTVHDRVWLAHGELGEFRIDITGGELLDSAVANGEGAFLVGAHLGSFEAINAAGQRRAGVSVAMAMYEENARKVRAMLDALRPRLRPEVIALGQTESMLRIREALERGSFVGLLADRTRGQEPLQRVEMLGATAYLPVGPMRAAALLRREVLFMTALYRGGNRYEVIFAPLADFRDVAADQRASAISAAVDRYAALLTHHCRESPWNWFNFYEFFR